MRHSGTCDPFALLAGDSPQHSCGRRRIVAVALVAGLMNGFLVTKGRIAPFIVTLGTMAIFRSLTLYIGKAGEFRSVSPAYGDMGCQ